MIDKSNTSFVDPRLVFLIGNLPSVGLFFIGSLYVEPMLEVSRLAFFIGLIVVLLPIHFFVFVKILDRLDHERFARFSATPRGWAVRIGITLAIGTGLAFMALIPEEAERSKGMLYGLQKEQVFQLFLAGMMFVFIAAMILRVPKQVREFLNPNVETVATLNHNTDEAEQSKEAASCDPRLKFIVMDLPSIIAIYGGAYVLFHYAFETVNPLWIFLLMAAVILYSVFLAPRWLKNFDHQYFKEVAASDSGRLTFMWTAIILNGLLLYGAWQTFVDIKIVSYWNGIPEAYIFGVLITVPVMILISLKLLRVPKIVSYKEES